tara:strand:+ start:3245 stop:3433 length:189 start_codon:yes stop_codon:yes gene_type:complete
MQLTEIESNVLEVALDHMHEHLNNLTGGFETFEEEKHNNDRQIAVETIMEKMRSKVKTYYIK